jgi:CHAT domain-containing protein/tetratricopeptide (TPR) repeat protein
MVCLIAILPASGFAPSVFAAPSLSVAQQEGIPAGVARLQKMDAGENSAAYIALAQANLAEAKSKRSADPLTIAERQVDLADGLLAGEQLDGAADNIAAALPVLEASGVKSRNAYLRVLLANGGVLHAKGSYAAAATDLRKAVEGLRTSNAAQRDRLLAEGLAALALAEVQMGKVDLAMGKVDEALALLKGLRPVPGILPLVYSVKVEVLNTGGKTAEALEVARKGIAESEALLKPDDARIANLYANMATLLVQQNRPTEALAMARRAFEGLEVARGGPTATSAMIRAIASTALIQGGKFDEAEPFLAQALPIMDAKMGAAHPQTLQVREIYARVLQRLGRGREAIGIQQQLLKTRDAALPRLHADRMTGRVNLAVIAMRIGEFKIATTAMDEGLSLRREAVPAVHPEFLAERALALHIRALDGQGGAALAKEAHGVFDGLRQIMDLDLDAPTPNGAHAGMLYVGESLFRSGDMDGAFRAQQWTARTSVDDAVALTRINRAVAGEQASLAVLAERKDLLVQRAAILSSVDAQLREPDAQFDLARANQRMEAVDGKLAKASAILTSAGVPFQRFREAGVVEVRKRIGRDDLFVMISRMTDRYMITAISRKGEWQYLTKLNSREVDVLVNKIRRSLAGAGDLAAFDRASVDQLYGELFSPEVQAALDRSRHLLVSSNGKPAALPFALMPDRKGGSGFLIDRIPVTRLPGAPQESVPTSQRQTSTGKFVGLGDIAQGAPAAGTASPRRGADALARLPALPGAAGELTEIARAVGDKSPVMLTGARATEANFRKVKLPRGGVLAFATHGLVSGEIPGLREPALLLSEGPGDDGLLTASEIARLDLPASWVILSACNTAAGSGPDAPSLSGLAQAFILAGADRIIATHWPVRDDVASAVTAGTLRYSGKGAAPAEALRRSLGDWRKGAGAKAHPSLWAAFELVRP